MKKFPKLLLNVVICKQTLFLTCVPNGVTATNVAIFLIGWVPLLVLRGGHQYRQSSTRSKIFASKGAMPVGSPTAKSIAPVVPIGIDRIFYAFTFVSHKYYGKSKLNVS